ncbi:MAG: S-adenosyl-L-homocysteine hydrolase [Modestobacter sp.]|nr:S-adenosyl-L-homocysteine hydrolase [Modestobacter sp.]
MLSRIDWVISNCRLLAGIGAEYEQTQPFAGLTIGTGIHLEPKTVALLLTLARGGARVVSTGNLNSTQQSAVDHLRAHGLTVIGGPTRDQAVHDADLAEVLSHRPDLILDNGGDLFARYLENPYEGLRGGTEETTSGRARLALLREQLAMPVLVINDSPIKQFAENRHAVGQSVLESLMRITNLVTNGRRVTVFGYGSCGKGVALNLRNAHAVVTVVESDPVLRLEALLDGFLVTSREEALSSADVVITVTGARDVVTAADLDLFKDGVILANAGHFPIEIDVPGLRSDARVAGVTAYSDGIEVLELADGRALRVLGEGHMVNLTGPRPLGNSLESMDLGFALQARCLEAVARGAVDAASCVVPVPADIDARVADDYVTGVTGAPSLLSAAG